MAVDPGSRIKVAVGAVAVATALGAASTLVSSDATGDPLFELRCEGDLIERTQPRYGVDEDGRPLGAESAEAAITEWLSPGIAPIVGITRDLLEKVELSNERNVYVMRQGDRVKAQFDLRKNGEVWQAESIEACVEVLPQVLPEG